MKLYNRVATAQFDDTSLLYFCKYFSVMPSLALEFHLQVYYAKENETLNTTLEPVRNFSFTKLVHIIRGISCRIEPFKRLVKKHSPNRHANVHNYGYFTSHMLITCMVMTGLHTLLDYLLFTT